MKPLALAHARHEVPALQLPGQHDYAVDKGFPGWSVSRRGLLSVGCMTCDYCGLPVGAVLSEGLRQEIEKFFPRAVWGKEFPDVPRAMASAASEAHVCLSAGSPRGAVALARSVVESVAKDKGTLEKSVGRKIDELHAAGHISEAMREAAHEIRIAGTRQLTVTWWRNSSGSRSRTRSWRSWTASWSASIRSLRR